MQHCRLNVVIYLQTRLWTIPLWNQKYSSFFISFFSILVDHVKPYIFLCGSAEILYQSRASGSTSSTVAYKLCEAQLPNHSPLFVLPDSIFCINSWMFYYVSVPSWWLGGLTIFNAELRRSKANNLMQNNKGMAEWSEQIR